MKESEVVKILQELWTDNIRQEREMFKHLAVLSAAIIAFFAAFKGTEPISFLSKLAIIGFGLVIVISILALFWIIKVERREIEKIRKYRKEGKEKILEGILSVLKSLLDFRAGSLKEFISSVKNIFVVCKREIEDYSNRKDNFLKDFQKKRSKNIVGTISYSSIGIFVVSLVLIAVDILR